LNLGYQLQNLARGVNWESEASFAAIVLCCLFLAAVTCHLLENNLLLFHLDELMTRQWLEKAVDLGLWI